MTNKKIRISRNMKIISFKHLIYLFFTFVSVFSQTQNVGALNFGPMMQCTIGKTLLLSDIINQRAQYQNSEQIPDFNGYELDILIRTVINNGLSFSSIQLTCYETQNDLENALSQGNIIYGIGGIQIDYTKLSQGFFYSLPLYTGGLKIAVRVNNDKTIWSFFDPFHWSLWVVMLVTTLFVSVVTWIFEDSNIQSYWCKSNKENSQKTNSNNESQNQKAQQINNVYEESRQEESNNSKNSLIKSHQNMQAFSNFLEMLWQSFSSLFFASSIRLQKFSSRIVFLGFWFVVIIVSATYVSNLTVLLAQSKNISQISSFQDIINSADVKIYTFQEYVGTYINPSIFKGKQQDIFVTFPKTKDGLNQLVKEFYQSSNSQNYLNHILLIDFPIVHNINSLYPCTTSILYETLSNFNYGVITKNQAVLKSLNSLLYNFIDDPYWLNQIQVYLNSTPIENSCYIKQKSIDLRSLSGLWIFIGVAIVIAIIINRIEALKLKYALKSQQKLKDQENNNQKNQIEKEVKQPKQIELQNLNNQKELEEIQSPIKKVEEGSQVHDIRNTQKSKLNQNSIDDQNIQANNNGPSKFDKYASYQKRDQSLFLSNNDIQADQNNQIWSDFLMVSDYIHIPSKDIHLQAEEDIKNQVNLVEQIIKKRFNNVEENIIRIMKKCPIKIGNKYNQDLEKIEEKLTIKKFKTNID
ncbi:ligand-gated ion channel protein (macronuclear) [Tetrahymena thermophila SB210]|uniref:Ligand-gated ion channel protein n=1 Tax=Tetrahymena thermophila (strain SB210) TaxID=312017 RepID=I7MDS8_TETTS|nr:ligand-gated ion channel protein [Tetrahymena thermophila SB210]EAR90882.2 ligand-gated ion channel protein [Tetrahymena thermophila SB210]|eukprot:XP_001011127.2 ligand-gated ion channel protein [Tetrahymena thermophila SB210]